MEIKKITAFFTHRITRNILFWLLFAFFHFYPRTNLREYFLVLGFSVLSYGIPVYINNLVLIPVFLLKRKYFLYTALFLVLMTLTVAETNYAFKEMGMGLSFQILHVLLLFTLQALGKFLSEAIQSQRSIELLQKQRLETELEGLKSQINPHFLFNALNTIYGMIRKTDKRTADAVLSLSEILRHNIYESNAEYISMEEEISLIRQYIAFAQLRHHQKENIKLNIQAEVDQQRIAPLLLLPFIENAIKHGLDKYVQHSYIDIELVLKENNLYFKCCNYCPSALNGKNSDKGVGLKNVQRRLQLCYSGRHHLQIDTKNDRYTAELKLCLI